MQVRHMPLITATGLAAAAFIALCSPGPRAVAQPAAMPQAAADPSGLYRQGQLDGLSAVFAFNRMNGTTPDLRRYAERSTGYRNATTFDREQVLAREIARLEGDFQRFDLDRTYVLRLRVPLMQYDSSKQGYAVGLGPDATIELADPVTFQRYGLQFRNTEEAGFVPVGDATAARNFSQRFGLDTQGNQAGEAVAEIAFRLGDAPPAVGTYVNVIRADILAARLVTRDGRPMFDFGTTRAATAAPGRPASGAAQQPVLKAVDIQGLRLGMPMAEADGVASRGWTTKVGTPGTGAFLYFNELRNPQGQWAVCDTIEVGIPDLLATSMGIATPPSYRDCIGYKLSRDGSGRVEDRVEAVAARQILAGVEPASLLSALREKYGAPTYVQNGGNHLLWVGRDPAHPDAAPVQIEADVGATGQGTQRAAVLSVHLARYVDPRPKDQPAPAPATGPKL